MDPLMAFESVKRQKMNCLPTHPSLDPCDDSLADTQASTWLYFLILPLLTPISLNPVKFTYFSNPRFCFRSSPFLKSPPMSRSEPSTWLPA